ncbi:uncharacterized protein LOC26534975 [Drosophila yakuba]|uniref:DUF7775 domain-containing protein n=1 Tax=Drosophila yakuba TaxID=7245 RepID=A0A0R1E9L3_DROYA|nr:uncharacterized protein LOC26534975 [Drosophila yakuba]KRK04691.1 uncharacterized protein Dyak_GE27794 [Drosophila yakuba]
MNKLYVHSTTDFLHIKPVAVRPTLFIFYTLETILNIICIGYHITGFQPLDWRGQEIHYICLIVFYVFILVNFFQSIAICTGRMPSVLVEIWKASVAAVAFILISLLTMWDVERQFSVFFVRPPSEQAQDEHRELPPVHPTFRYKKGQAISSLSCGLIYMLHAVIMFDVRLTSKLVVNGSQHLPIPLFVLGRAFHRQMSKYEWFTEFCGNNTIDL